MGANMARRMKECGHAVSVVFDVVPDLAREIAGELGATAAGSLAEVTREADVIVTVVTDDAAMRAIFAEDALLAAAGGKVSSTVRRSALRCMRRLERHAGQLARSRWKPAWPRAFRRRARARFI